MPTKPGQTRRIDAHGRVIFAADDAFELAYAGHDITTLWFDPDPVIARYNEACESFDRTADMLATPDAVPDAPTSTLAALAILADTWHIPPPYDRIAVRDYLLTRLDSADAAAHQRTNEEMDQYEARGLEPLLQLLLALVEHWRQQGVVWGVGRGSSVASYVLYLIGVHHVDSLAYGLPLSDFLKS